MKKTSNFKSKNVLTLKDLKKISQYREYNMSLEEAYEIAAGYRDITSKDPKARNIIFARAMNMVRNDDPEFAQLITNERKANNNKSLETVLSLNSAYDIVGGYRDADADTYKKALELVKLDSPEFAEILSKLKESGSSFKAASVGELKDFSERLEKNIDTALEVYNKSYIEDITDEVLEDEAVIEAFNNTPITDDKGVELVDEERDNAERLVVHTSALEEIQNVVEATSDDELAKEKVVENVKNRTLFNIGALRIGANRAKTKDHIQAIKNNSESFFTNTLSKLRNAFNFKKKVTVKQSSIVEKFNKAKKSFSSFIGKIKEKVSSSKLKAKINKLATSIATAAVIVASCGPVNLKSNENKDVKDTTITHVIDTTSKQEADTTATFDLSSYKLETSDIKEEIRVPSEWNEDMGISQKRWNLLTSNYFRDKNGNNNYDKFYKAISSDMLEQGGIFEGKTREQVLSFYGYLKAYNLHAHQDAIKILDSFFKNCNGEGTIDIKDYKEVMSVMKQFTPTGEVIGFNLEGDHWVESMTFGDCGEKTKLNTKKPVKPVVTKVTETTADTTTLVHSDTLDVVFETVTHKPDTTVIEKQDTISVGLYRGNNTNPAEGEFVSTASVDDVLSEKPNNDRKVVIEQTTYNSTIADTSSVATTATTATSDTLATAQTKVTITETTIVVSSKESETTTETIETTAVADTLRTSDAQFIEVVDGVEYDVNIVSDSDSLAVGTPAADNVAERGGYDNSGLTEAQYMRAVNHFQKDGNTMFYTLVEGVKAHPELRTKGGIAEGLSAEETVYLLMVADLWGGKGQFKEEVTEFINYVNDCDKELNLSESIKNIFNRGNINASMDGIVGKNSNQVDHLELGDCGENPNQVVKGNGKATTPSNPVSEKFPEFYKIRNTRELPIVFEEEVHEAKTITTTIEEQQQVDITLMRGNDFDVSAGEVVRDDVPVSEVQNLRANKDREVIISTSQTYFNDEVMSRREKRRAAREANSDTTVVTSSLDR